MTRLKRDPTSELDRWLDEFHSRRERTEAEQAEFNKHQVIAVQRDKTPAAESNH